MMQIRSSSWTAIQFPPELYSALSGKSRVAALMKNPAFEEGGSEGGPFQRPVEHGGARARARATMLLSQEHGYGSYSRLPWVLLRDSIPS